MVALVEISILSCDWLNRYLAVKLGCVGAL